MRNFLFLFLFLFSGGLFAQKADTLVVSQPDKVARAIEFPDTLKWLNTQMPLSLRNFEGHFLLLNFWTSSSSLSLGQLKELKRLDEIHDNLSIIIVHSGKYESEGQTATLRNFIIENDVPFTVINDSAFVMFSEYGIEAWPTNILIDPTGKIMLRSEGMSVEGDISALIELYDGPSKTGGSYLFSETQRFNQGVICYPTFIASDEQFSLFISETRSHRILQTDRGGYSEHIIGSGFPGFEDGNQRSARFYLPRGVAFDRRDSVLYIADTGNDAIRKFNLETRQVTTVLGNGERASTPPEMIVDRSHRLNQPTDLVVVDGALYITMTGWNQIWMMDIESGMATPVAGDGQFGFTEGRALQSNLAEPFGITADESGIVYFTERQSSGIRSLNKGRLLTIMGQGTFEYGDEDGRSKKALMRGPSGITYHNERLYVSDQYNQKIKVVDPNKGISETFLGSGQMGFRSGVPQRIEFNHPTGLAVFNNELFIADTYNQVVRRYNFETEIIRSFDLMNKDQMEFNPINIYEMFEIDTLIIPRGESQVVLNFQLDSLWTLAQNAPHGVVIKSKDSGVKIDPQGLDEELGAVVLHLENYGSYNHFVADITLFYTDVEHNQNTYIKSFTILAPVQVQESAPLIQDVTVPLNTY